MMRGWLVAAALTGTVLSGCGSTEAEVQTQELASAESALGQCLWFRGWSADSYEDACNRAVQDGQLYCDTYWNGVQSISRTCTIVATSEPYVADKYICCY